MIPCLPSLISLYLHTPGRPSLASRYGSPCTSNAPVDCSLNLASILRSSSSCASRSRASCASVGPGVSPRARFIFVSFLPSQSGSNISVCLSEPVLNLVGGGVLSRSIFALSRFSSPCHLARDHSGCNDQLPFGSA